MNKKFWFFEVVSVIFAVCCVYFCIKDSTTPLVPIFSLLTCVFSIIGKKYRVKKNDSTDHLQQDATKS